MRIRVNWPWCAGQSRSLLCEGKAARGEPVWPEDAGVAPGAGGMGWVEHYDEGSGRTYYHNTDTNETSWTKPELSLIHI